MLFDISCIIFLLLAPFYFHFTLSTFHAHFHYTGMCDAYSAAVTSDSQTWLSVSVLDSSPLLQHCLFQEVEEWQWLWYLKMSYWPNGNNTDSIRNIESLDSRYSRDISAILCGAAVNHFDWLPFGYSLRAPVIVADTLATLKHSCCVIRLPQNSQNMQNFRYKHYYLPCWSCDDLKWWQPHSETTQTLLTVCYLSVVCEEPLVVFEERCCEGGSEEYFC